MLLAGRDLLLVAEYQTSATRLFASSSVSVILIEVKRLTIMCDWPSVARHWTPADSESNMEFGELCHIGLDSYSMDQRQ